MNQLLLNALNFATNILCKVNLHCISNCLEHDGQVYDRVLRMKFTGGILRDLVDPVLGSDRVRYHFRETNMVMLLSNRVKRQACRHENLEDDFSHTVRN